MILVDLQGLARTHFCSGFFESVTADLGEFQVIEPEHRMTYLRRLREGAGVHVVTGPEGAAFWMPASVEVHIDILPDGTELHERCAPDLAWGLQVMGVGPLPAAVLAQRAAEGKEPTAKARVYAQFQQAKSLVDAFAEHTEAYGSIVVEASHIEAVTDPAEQLALLDRVENAAMDFEWNIDPDVAPMYEVEGMSVATADRTWYLPVVCSDFRLPAAHGERLRERVRASVLRTPTVWHNAKADLGTQWPGAPLDAFGSGLHDTLVMAFVAGYSNLALKPLARELLRRDPLDFPGAMRNLPLDTCRRYGGADSRNTYDLFPVLFQQLQERQQWHVYDEIERPIISLLVDMEREGHPIDPAKAEGMADEYARQCEVLRQKYLSAYGLDISKDKETRELIKRLAGYDPGSLAKDAIAKIPDPWMDDILRYRQIRHRKRSFLDKHVEKWHAAGSPPDWRVYTSLNQAGTADRYDQRSFKKAPRSGRLSSAGVDKIPPGGVGASGGNLMNQPNAVEGDESEDGLEDVHSIFVAPPGHVIWDRDYSALEMRIQAAVSMDPNMLRVLATKCTTPPCTHFPKCGDPHDDLVYAVMQKSGKRIPRVGAKQGNFNGAYGGYTDMLRVILQKLRVFLSDEDLLLIVETQKAVNEVYFRSQESVVEYARINGGYSETAFGRRRYEPDVFSSDTRTRLHAERSLMNHRVQGTAADVLKIGMRLIVPVLRHYGAHLALQIHDELEGWCPEDVVDPFLADIDRALAPVQLLPAPLLQLAVEGGYGRTWAGAKH